MDNSIKEAKILCSEFDKLSELLTFEEVLVDKKLFLSLDRKLKAVAPVVDAYRTYVQLLSDKDELEKIIDTAEKEEKRAFLEELDSVKINISSAKNDISAKLKAYYAVFERVEVEIECSSACRLLDDLITSYCAFCEHDAFDCSVVKRENNYALLIVEGVGVMDTFNSECGLHYDGKNVCKVFVLKNDNKFVVFDERDVEFTTCRASGAGGQHINKTDSAVHAKHIPSGISVFSQEQRSYFQNKETALERLKQRVEAHYDNLRKQHTDTQKRAISKSFSSANYIKHYDYDADCVMRFDNRQFSIKEFLSGLSVRI